MKTFVRKIVDDSIIINNDIIKVDSFLNHQIDVQMIKNITKHICHHFIDVDRVITIETSGIVIAYSVAEALGDKPLVFAKKSKSAIVDQSNVYKADIKSFTRNTVSPVTIDKRFIKEGEKVLIVDDFLAEGNAAIGLIDICRQAGAIPVGVAVAIEKGFQGGRKRIESEGIEVYSVACIKEFKDNKPVF